MEFMWVTGACVSALLAVVLAHWINARRRNGECNRSLPPGSLGLPLIGETLQLAIPSYSLDLVPFLKTRIQRYGKLFRTRVAGQKVVVSADPEFCNFVFQQDGRLFELWYLDTFSKIFTVDATNISDVHRYIRATVLKRFGMDALRQRLLPVLEREFRAAVRTWSQQESVNAKYVFGTMALEFGAKQILSDDLKQSLEKLGDVYFSLAKGLHSIPLNIPGTTHYKCLKNRKKALSTIREIVKDRLASQERSQQETPDILDHIIGDMKTKKFLTEEFVVEFLFSLLFVAYETVSTTLTLAIKLLGEHPRVLQELIDEHEKIRKSKEDSESPITWNEYKSMSFSFNVINEVLRLGNTSPGLFRRANKDVEVNGYTIPAGWGVMVATSALHMDPETYEDPTTFNPWRWMDCKPEAMVKNFLPFGWGMRQCAGAEYSRVFLVIFLHVLVTGYRWKVVKGGEVRRSPMLDFGRGMHIKFMKKHM